MTNRERLFHRPLRCLALFAAAVAPFAQSAEIRWLPADRPVAVEVRGVSSADLAPISALDPADSAWARVLAVFAEQRAGEKIPPMAGAWTIVSGDRLRFEPQFPLVRGVRYRAEFRATGATPLVSFFELAADTTASATTVLHVFPSAATLPENQLKFYVHFSAPMSRGRTFGQIELRDATGRAIELPFLELDKELWDPAMTRLTLLIDPGRIKRGVKPLEDIGPVFEAGKKYSLTIGSECRDAEGRPLRVGFEKKFLVGPADRTPPDPARWKITAPAAGTRAPLVVAFGEPMDHALALRMIGVVLPTGAALDGEIALGAEEREWRFVPAQPWPAGPHRLVVATMIEDLAGNRIGKPFDVDLFEEVQRRIDTPTVEVTFVIK